MPYVITTKRPGSAYAGSPFDQVSRRAVATLEEANSAVFDFVAGSCIADDANARHNIGQLPESGGTVGPLPDGTVIEVERREWIDIAREIGADSGDLCACPNAEIIDAYNARES